MAIGPARMMLWTYLLASGLAPVRVGPSSFSGEPLAVVHASLALLFRPTIHDRASPVNLPDPREDSDVHPAPPLWTGYNPILLSRL